ncbi:hypothetical protein EalM132_00138 [Exiguobacterium phage vB_EalM-132]|nr:hypothetical protein EalM132_00138 [Exiguobacterium phage vB_EalM-132]
MSKVRIACQYRIDNRTKHAQIDTSGSVMLVSLSDFQRVSSIIYFEESTGTINLTTEEYLELWGLSTWKSARKS